MTGSQWKFSLIFLVIFTVFGHAAEPIQGREEWIRPIPIPTPQDNPITEKKVALGRKLFFDPILSRANNISCSSCHDPVKGWSDADPVATGDQGRKGTRNSPTLLNSAYQYVYFLDGRAKTLEAQALGPIESHVEMNLAPTEAVQRLRKDPLYQQLFQEVFPSQGITVDTLSKAIATFERTLVSGQSRFDRWITGEASQLTEDESKGFAVFLDKGNCGICHNGFNFTDQSFNNVGINNGDMGRQSVKNRPIWQGTFKVPTLRNIGNSAPYFHDGSVPTLMEAVTICARGGRDRNAPNKSDLLADKHLTENEIQLIVSFLHTLNEPVPDFN